MTMPRVLFRDYRGLKTKDERIAFVRAHTPQGWRERDLWDWLEHYRKRARLGPRPGAKSQ